LDIGTTMTYSEGAKYMVERERNGLD